MEIGIHAFASEDIKTLDVEERKKILAKTVFELAKDVFDLKHDELHAVLEGMYKGSKMSLEFAKKLEDLVEGVTQNETKSDQH